MKILQIGKFYPPHMGGIETHLETLSVELVHTADVRVVVANDGRDRLDQCVTGVPVTRVGTLMTLASAPLCPAMVSAIRSSNADLVHVHLPNPTAVLAYLASGHPGPLVVTYHSDTVRQKILGGLLQPFLHRFLARASAVIATSPQYLSSSPVLARHHSRCHVVPYGIRTGEFASCDAGRATAIRRQFGNRIILAVGRLVYYKGFEYLIEAMKEVEGQLLLIGDGPLRGSLEAAAAARGVTDRVTFLGTVQNGDIAPYYHAADVFVLPSVARSEAFGIVQIEAMAAGVPVINTQLDSGVPFVSQHEVTGLTVPPANAAELAGAINRVLDNRGLRLAYGRAARTRAQELFSVQAMTRRTIEIYQKIVVGRQPHVPADTHGKNHSSASLSLMAEPRVLFFVEGYTDIRFVVGLSQICCLTMAVPEAAYRQSGLKDRITASGARVVVDEIRGGRLRFQVASLLYLLKHAKQFDVILCQEVLRGAFNGTLVGALKKVPVITYMGISPVEYFRCRRERAQIGPIKAWLGEAVIGLLMRFNGRLATTCLAMGPYLRDIAAQYCPRSEIGLYYGVDTEFFRPVSEEERICLRQKHHLPLDKFIILLSSRVSHEKDPETVLRAAALARKKGVDAVVLNLGGGYKDFLKLAGDLRLEDLNDWVLGHPAVHPMNELADYYRCADVTAQASLAEGCGISPLEALACGVPAVCTAVGGMKANLHGLARLTPKRDAEAMCDEFLWIAANRERARAEALQGREYVIREWDRKKAFGDISSALRRAVGHREFVAARSVRSFGTSSAAVDRAEDPLE